MATECHKTASYQWQQIGGMLVLRQRGRSKIYSARCSHCNRSFEFTAPQMRKAIKQPRATLATVKPPRDLRTRLREDV